MCVYVQLAKVRAGCLEPANLRCNNVHLVMSQTSKVRADSLNAVSLAAMLPSKAITWQLTLNEYSMPSSSICTKRQIKAILQNLIAHEFSSRLEACLCTQKQSKI